MGPAEWIYGIFNFRYGDYVVGTKLDIVRSCSLNVHRSVDTHTHNHTHTHTHTHTTHTHPHTPHTHPHTHTHTLTSRALRIPPATMIFFVSLQKTKVKKWKENGVLILRFVFVSSSLPSLVSPLARLQRIYCVASATLCLTELLPACGVTGRRLLVWIVRAKLQLFFIRFKL